MDVCEWNEIKKNENGGVKIIEKKNLNHDYAIQWAIGNILCSQRYNCIGLELK